MIIPLVIFDDNNEERYYTCREVHEVHVFFQNSGFFASMKFKTSVR